MRHNIKFLLLLYSFCLLNMTILLKAMEDDSDTDFSVFFLPKSNHKEKLTEQKKSININTVYFHGAGESGKSGLNFDYENQKIKNSSFYGQQNVRTAVSHLKNLKDNRFHLEGISMGSGVLLTTLEQLCSAADNTTHCLSNIVTQEEAKDLIAKINAGYITLSVPIFSMQHTQLMVFASRSFSLITISLLLFLLKNTLLKEISYKKQYIILIGLVFLLHNMLSNQCSDIFDKKIIPRFISENYNPYDSSPLEATKNIRKHITCPIYIHISKQDELLFYRAQNIKNFINYLSIGENIDPTKQSKTFLLLSGDDTHDQNNGDHEKVKKALKTSFINKNTIEGSDLSLHKNSNFYSLYNNRSAIDSIKYKEPMFPLIDSGIKVFKTVKERLFL